MDDSTIISDEVIDADADTKSNKEVKPSNETNFDEKKATCTTQNFYILLAVLLFTRALLISTAI